MAVCFKIISIYENLIYLVTGSLTKLFQRIEVMDQLNQAKVATTATPPQAMDVTALAKSKQATAAAALPASAGGAATA